MNENKNPDQKQLIESATKSDLTIKIKDHIFLGHTDILSTRNAVFNSTISALSATSNLSSTIEISDFEPKIFEIFLKYIYTQNLDKKDISTELMNVAHKYDLNLLKICEDNLVSSISEGNAVKWVIFGTFFDSEKVREEASKFIVKNFAKMIEREDFQQVKENPAVVEAIFRQLSIKFNSMDVSLRNCDEKIGSMNRSLSVLHKTIDFMNKSFSVLDKHYYSKTFVLKVPSKPSDEYSELFVMNNVSWKIYASLRSKNLRHLGLYLECHDDDNIPVKHTVDYNFKLISGIDQIHDFKENSTRVTFNLTKDDKNPAWGWPKFVSFDELNDNERGLITNGKITVQLNLQFLD